ncbi:hypothetical protein Taro_055103, partial [Colocasia esculenta]|nr:hypothetical protein [Colocasia esculenta]
MVVPKKGTSTLLARPCRVLLGEHLALCCRWLAFHQGPSVSYRRVWLLYWVHMLRVWLLFSLVLRLGFVIGLRVRVGVSRRLREPTCGVAFTGAGLWSAEPVEALSRQACRGILPCHDNLVVATCFPNVTYLSRSPYPSGWDRDGLGGLDKTRLASVVFRGCGWRVGVCPRARLPLGPSGGNAAGCLSAFNDQ